MSLASTSSGESPAFDLLLAQPPQLHGGTTHSLVEPALRWLHDLPRPLRTLETGCGLSTLVFALRGDRHVCITPSGDERDRVLAYCAEHELSADRLDFIIDPSERALPGLAVEPVDLVLIDGSHAFPNVFIDYFYASRLLAAHGLLVVDDVHLWTGKVLRDFLLSEPQWALVTEWDGRTVSFRKLHNETEHRDWFDQDYVSRRSSPTLTRIRMATSMLKRRDFRSLERYARGVLGRA